MIAYKHVRNGAFSNEGTLAIELPGKELLLELFKTHSTSTIMSFGYSIVSKKDHFNKKTGRTVAEKRMSPQVVSFTGVRRRNLQHIYDFNVVVPNVQVDETDITINFGLGVVVESNQVRLYYADMYQTE